MFTSKSTLLIVALSTLGIAGWTVGNDSQDDRATSAPAATAAAGPGIDEPEQRPAILLLHDGRIVNGLLSEEDGIYIVTQPIGVMRFPRKRVERVFTSIREVYAYKLEQLPENDFDERIKLARWCLEQKLEPEAGQQLAAVLKRSPKDAQAKAMLASIDQAQARLASRSRDPEIQRTGAELVQPAAGERPNTLDAAVFYGARRGMGISDLPEVFDLPTSQAVKRTDEFARYVHPVLQVYCARCHNETYNGQFQLVQIRSKIDQTRDALRANLDATLKLIDRENPPHSELLASSLRPHGRGPNMRPIFQGSNDRAYQILATWVNRLQAPSVAQGVVPAAKSRPASPANEAGETFASQRGGIAESGDQLVPASTPFATGPVTNKVLPPVRVVPGKGVMPDTSVDPNEFPLPFAVSGTRPVIGTKPPMTQPPPINAGKPRGSASPDKAASAQASRAAAIPAPRKFDPSHAADTAAGAGPKSGPSDPDDPDETDTPKKKPRKPVTLDPAILQRALQQRNQGR